MLRSCRQIVLALCCIGLLGACGSLPKPFAHSGATTNNPLLALAGGGAIRVQVSPELPASLAKPLAENMIKSLWAENVPASKATSFRPRYILNGALKINYLSVSDPEQVEIIWSLRSADGEKLDAFDLRVTGDRAGWLFLDKELLVDLSADMGREVVRMLYAQQRPKRVALKQPVTKAQPASKSSAEILNDPGAIPQKTTSASTGDSAILPKKSKIYLAEIIGAPGDGNISLLRNLRRSMIIAGADIVPKRLGSDFLVKGFVNVSPPYDATNDVAIPWLVATKEGRELGKVTQNNKVPVGALNGRWGDMAHVIAQGGSIGIIDIVEQYLAPSDGKKGLIIPR